MSNFAKNAIKTIVILVVSIGIGFGLTYIIAESSSEIAATSLPFIMLPTFTIISAIILRKLLGSGMKKSGGGPWGSPEQARDRVINQPQFVGRFDREKGLLETTVRMAVPERTSHQAWFMGQAEELTVYRFRGELLDQNGSPLDYIPVEIKGKSNKWVGVLADGDRVRVKGKIEDDGALHAKNAFNFSTNSWVGEK